MDTENLSFGVVLFEGALWGGLSLLVAYAVRRIPVPRTRAREVVA